MINRKSGSGFFMGVVSATSLSGAGFDVEINRKHKIARPLCLNSGDAGGHFIKLFYLFRSPQNLHHSWG